MTHIDYEITIFYKVISHLLLDPPNDDHMGGIDSLLGTRIQRS